MSEFFLELFSEEIPSNLQQNLREDLLKSFNDFFLEKSILFKKSSSYSTPNRLVVLFEGVQKNVVIKSEEIKGPNIKRGIKMFDKLGVKILGLVDNMSYFIGDDGKKYKIFGEGGVKKTAEEFQKEFLGEIPINPEIGKTGDEGKPIVEASPEHEISKVYLNFAEKIKSIYL